MTEEIRNAFNVNIFFTVLPPVLVPRHSEWPPLQPRLPPPYHTMSRENPNMPTNASFPPGFSQSPADDRPSPFRTGETFTPYEIPGIYNTTHM